MTMIEDITPDHPDYKRITQAIDINRCPDCGWIGFREGPRGGANQNIFCMECGSGFNVGPRGPRYHVGEYKVGTLFVQRITQPRRELAHDQARLWQRIANWFRSWKK